MTARNDANVALAQMLPAGWLSLYLSLLESLPDGFVVASADMEIGRLIVRGEKGLGAAPLLTLFAERSTGVCVICGADGVLRDAQPIRPLCDAHAREAGAIIPLSLVPMMSEVLATPPEDAFEGAEAPADCGEAEPATTLVEDPAEPADTPASDKRSSVRDAFADYLSRRARQASIFTVPRLKVLDVARMPSSADERVTGWSDQLKRPLELKGAAAMAETLDGQILLAAQLAARAPWLSNLAEIVERSLRLQLALGRPWVKLDPLLIVGAPGAGKSYWARLLASMSGCGIGLLDLGGSPDARGLEGTSRTWSNMHPSWPVSMMASTQCANAILVVDEVDKAGGSDRNGRARNVLLGMLEPATAKAYPDPCLQAPVDLSQCSWLLTANTLDTIERPLLSRLHVVEVQGPRPEHAETIIESVAGALATEWGWPPAAMPKLPASVKRAIEDVLERHRSVRAARRVLSVVYAATMRDRQSGVDA